MFYRIFNFLHQTETIHEPCFTNQASIKSVNTKDDFIRDYVGIRGEDVARGSNELNFSLQPIQETEKQLYREVYWEVRQNPNAKHFYECETLNSSLS